MKSHALSYLVGLVEEHHVDAPPELSEADVLSPWAVEFRYEGEEPPAFDRPAALTLVAKLRTWAEGQIETAEQPQDPRQHPTKTNRSRARSQPETGPILGPRRGSSTAQPVGNGETGTTCEPGPGIERRG